MCRKEEKAHSWMQWPFIIIFNFIFNCLPQAKLPSCAKIAEQTKGEKSPKDCGISLRQFASERMQIPLCRRFKATRISL